MTDDHHNDEYEDTGEIRSGVAALDYEDWAEPEEIPCVVCGGEIFVLGRLGGTTYAKCRYCGYINRL